MKERGADISWNETSTIFLPRLSPFLYFSSVRLPIFSNNNTTTRPPSFPTSHCLGLFTHMASKDDVVEQIVDHDTSPAQDVNNAVGGDDELAELLTSALDDFNKEPQPSKATAEPPSQKAPSGKKKKKATTTNHPEASSSGGPIPFGLDGANSVDEVFQNLFSQDPVLKEHWEKLAESCSKAGEFDYCDNLRTQIDNHSLH